LNSDPATAAGEPKLLLLPIVVHSAEDPAYLREGLNDMLTARLARIGALDLIQPEGKLAERGTSQLEKARALGEKAGADFVLFGSFTRFGQGASLDVQCVPIAEGRSAEPLREIFVHSGSIGEIIPDLDDLAGKVSRFARGEIIPSAAAGAAGAGAVAVPAAELQNLRGRVAALEAALERLTENAEAAGTTGELR
jgi:TolB-like protein